MPKIYKYLSLLLIGGIIYGALEILYRGHTHWTMLITGGVCGILLYLIVVRFQDALWKKWIMGGAVITAVEFVVGGIVNIILGWDVWNYSSRPVTLMGQICLRSSIMWVLLCIPAMAFLKLIDTKLFNKRVG